MLTKILTIITSIRYAKNHDYLNFYKEEMAIRKQLNYSPYYFITLVRISCKDYEEGFKHANKIKDYLEKNLAVSMQDFISKLDNLNVLEKRLMQNDKDRSISLFGNNLNKREDIFSHIYSCNYEISYVGLAQAQRHRTLFYQMERMKEKKYFVPPILKNDCLKNEWLEDITSIADIIPQGELVLVNETGTYDNFILKTKERLCTSAQLEVMRSTRDTLLKYKEVLEQNNSYLKDDIKKYVKGARCTFGFNCPKKCDFKEGITLEREI